MDAATATMLIVVTMGGNVSQSSYSTKHLCEEARNLAVTGYTLEQSEKNRLRNEEEDERFRLAHPPREPQDQSERLSVDVIRHGGLGLSAMDSNGACYSVTKDLKIQECRPFSNGGQIVQIGPNTIKTFECVPAH